MRIGPALRLDALVEWIEAVDLHVPAVADPSVATIAAWPQRRVDEFVAELTVLANVFRGRRPASELTPVVQNQLAGLAAEIDVRGRTGFLERAAILHPDIAIAGSDGTVKVLAVAPEALIKIPNTFTAFDDGRYSGAGTQGMHWEFARLLLDWILRDDPENATVLLWYRAVAAHLADRHLYAEAVPHLEKARQRFAKDADILFDSGWLHETFAASRIQDTIQSASDKEAAYAVGSIAGNLRAALKYFGEAVGRRTSFSEARLRRARVLGLMGRHQEAARELRVLVTVQGDSRLTYFANLFLGSSEHALGNNAEAAAAYSRALEAFPLSQSPRVALSALRSSTGDRSAARVAVVEALQMPANRPQTTDPWWTYVDGPGLNRAELWRQLLEAIPARR